METRKSCLVEEKMIEIAGILAISVEGRIEEIRASIRGLLVKEFGCKKPFENSKRKKRVKGTRELVNLASSINYDCGVKLLGS